MTKYRSRLEERLSKWLSQNDYSFEYETVKLDYTLSAV